MKQQLSTKIINAKHIDKEWAQVKECITLNKHKKRGKDNAYINDTVFAYDSETSNYIDENGDKKPFVFSLMLTVMNPENDQNINILARNITDYENVIKKIAQYIGCKVTYDIKYDKKGVPMMTDHGDYIYSEENNTYMDVFVHNLPFDASFLIPRENVYKMFASSTHKPYYYITTLGVQYKDTVVLTQKTLDALGKGLTKFGVRKAVGDFDYNKIRTGLTPFTKKEYGYVTNDTLVLAAYIDEELDTYHHLCNLPMTMTGTVRDFARSAMNGTVDIYKQFYNSGILPKNSKAYKLFKDNCTDAKLLSDACKEIAGTSGNQLKMTPSVYHEMRRAYTGGFTHSNPYHTGKTMTNMQSWDFTSSYPTRMVSEKYAINDGVRIGSDNEELISKLKSANDDDLLYMFDVSFDSIESKVDYDFYLSVSKCECDSDSLVESNGRVVCAKNVKTTMLSTDWETFSKVYNMKGIKFSNVYMYQLDYLPLGLVMSVLYFYKQKTELKGIVGRERDYMRGKERLNSLYGMCVQDPIKDDVTYHDKDGWFTYKTDNFSQDLMDKRIDIYNSSRTRFLYYMWGIQISSYSRRELWKGIMECGQDYVYSDTDSIKVTHADKHKDFIDKYNQEITDKINKCLSHYNLDQNLATPVDIKGNKHQLGVWDPNDGFYSYFKTLGAKRYIDISKDNDVFEITIAGLSKQKGTKYMLDQTNQKYIKIPEGYKMTEINSKNVKRLFAYFDDELYVPADQTGKLAHYYVDHYDSFKVKDYQGREATIDAGGGCLLKATDFTLSMSRKFSTFLDNLLNGYIQVDSYQGLVL